MNLDPHCVTCEHGKLLPLQQEMGRTLFCEMTKERCQIERTGTEKTRCGPSAKNYRKQR